MLADLSVIIRSYRLKEKKIGRDTDDVNKLMTLK